MIITITQYFRSGEDWRTTRSKSGQQSMPANVYGYCPGFTKASKRFVRNVKDLQNDDGTVNDVRDLIRNWSLEGISHHFLNKYKCCTKQMGQMFVNLTH